MDKKSADLKAATSHTPIDGLHAKNSYKYRQENQKIIEEREIVPKKFCTEEIQSKQKINQRNLKLKTMYVGNLYKISVKKTYMSSLISNRQNIYKKS